MLPNNLWNLHKSLMDSVIIPMKIVEVENGVCFLALYFNNFLSLLSKSCHDAVSFNAGLVGDAVFLCVHSCKL